LFELRRGYIMGECKTDKLARLIIQEQIPIIRKMIQDECWYEGQRRHSPVDPDDPQIRQRVGEIIMQCGAKMREEATERLLNRIGKIDE